MVGLVGQKMVLATSNSYINFLAKVAQNRMKNLKVEDFYHFASFGQLGW